ncbi:MAG TPA: YmaF family protein, partial [Bacillota bacterium]|nr:YmaF family protein [Bacillota bacterium]
FRRDRSAAFNRSTMQHACNIILEYEDHHHEVVAVTGQPIEAGNGRHAYFVMSQTTLIDGHIHELQFATLIQSPISD